VREGALSLHLHSAAGEQADGVADDRRLRVVNQHAVAGRQPLVAVGELAHHVVADERGAAVVHEDRVALILLFRDVSLIE
jgi:hypothetical protein